MLSTTYWRMAASRDGAGGGSFWLMWMCSGSARQARAAVAYATAQLVEYGQDLAAGPGLGHQAQAGALQALDHLVPGIVHVGAAERDLEIGLRLPQLLDGREPVHARHAHVHERDVERLLDSQRGADQRDGALARLGERDL